MVPGRLPLTATTTTNRFAEFDVISGEGSFVRGGDGLFITSVRGFGN
jgi:hypothetical protein